MDWEEDNLTKNWTVVMSRKRKNNRNRKNNTSRHSELSRDDVGSSDQVQPSSMVAGETDTLTPEEYDKIMNKMHNCLKKVAESAFYNIFLEQLQSPEILNNISRVLGTDSKLQMVLYGIGSINNSERSRLQLSLALLLKRGFCWVGDMEVFDPIVSVSERRVIESLGCTFLDVNEKGRRTANRPTLFFMPHCEAFLYDNVIEANWSPLLLNRIVLFGNSFSSYLENSPLSRKPPRHVLAISEHVHEFRVRTVSGDFFPAFNHMSWQFFALDPLLDLRNLQA